MKDKHFTSRMLTCAGVLMSISGILISIGAKLAYGGILFASAACMFFGLLFPTVLICYLANRKKDDTAPVADEEV